MKKEETINTTGGVYVTRLIYKTKPLFLGRVMYTGVNTLIKQETLPKRLLRAFKRITVGGLCDGHGFVWLCHHANTGSPPTPYKGMN